MRRNRDEKLAMFQVFVAETVIFRAEDQRNFTFPYGSDDRGRDFFAAFGCGCDRVRLGKWCRRPACSRRWRRG